MVRLALIKVDNLDLAKLGQCMADRLYEITGSRPSLKSITDDYICRKELNSLVAFALGRMVTFAGVPLSNTHVIVTISLIHLTFTFNGARILPYKG